MADELPPGVSEYLAEVRAIELRPWSDVDDPAVVLAQRIRARFGEIERRQRWADG